MMTKAWLLLTSCTKQEISNKPLSTSTWFTREARYVLITFFLLVVFISWRKIMICGLLEMKKLLVFNLILLSVMETWQTHGRKKESMRAIRYYLITIELRPNFADAWPNLASR